MKNKFWGILSEERVESFFEKGRLKHENTVDDLREKLRLALTQHSSLNTLCLYPEAKPKSQNLIFEKFFFLFFSFYFSYYYIYGFTFVMPWWFSRAFFTFNSCSRIIGFCFFSLVGGSMEPKRPTLTRKCKSFQRANPIIFFLSLQLIGRISQNWLICVHKTATQRYLSNTSRFFVHQKIKTVRFHLV